MRDVTGIWSSVKRCTQGYVAAAKRQQSSAPLRSGWFQENRPRSTRLRLSPSRPLGLGLVRVRVRVRVVTRGGRFFHDSHTAIRTCVRLHIRHRFQSPHTYTNMYVHICVRARVHAYTRALIQARTDARTHAPPRTHCVFSTTAEWKERGAGMPRCPVRGSHGRTRRVDHDRLSVSSTCIWSRGSGSQL